MQTVRWPHVECGIAHYCEQRERAFLKWRESGYRDMVAHGQYLKYGTLANNAATASVRYICVK